MNTGVFGRIILISFVLNAGLYAQNTLSDSIKNFLSARGYKDKNIGIVIKQAGDSSVIVDINGDRKYNPASVQKLVTASAAVSLLGSGYKFRTLAYADGAFSKDSGVLHGDLIVKGNGDPGFTAEKLWLFVRQLANSGIKVIEGDLVLDDSFFDDESIGPGFNEDNSSRAYEAPAAALSASFNTVAVFISPGSVYGAPVIVNTLPGIYGMKIFSTAVTTDSMKMSDIRVKTEKTDNRTAVFVSGTMSVNSPSKCVYAKVWETWENFGCAMQELFNESKIQFTGKIRRAAASDSLLTTEPVLVFESQPVFETIKPMFKVSSNFAAEMLFKTLAAEKSGAPGSWTAGSKIVEKWWIDSGFPGEINAVNGSGMGNGNRISPTQICALLEWAYDNKTIMPDFMGALASAGKDGTLEKRFTDSHLAGKIRAKTGTLNNYGVSSLAGYVLLNNKTFIFSIMMNGAGADQYRHWVTQQKILEMVFQKSAE